MLSTILFIEEQPVGYTVLVERDRCFFKPTEYSQATIDAPSFYVSKKNEVWELEGWLDQKIIDQLQPTLSALADEEEISLSAAP